MIMLHNDRCPAQATSGDTMRAFVGLIQADIMLETI